MNNNILKTITDVQSALDIKVPVNSFNMLSVPENERPYLLSSMHAISLEHLDTEIDVKIIPTDETQITLGQQFTGTMALTSL